MKALVSTVTMALLTTGLASVATREMSRIEAMVSQLPGGGDGVKSCIDKTVARYQVDLVTAAQTIANDQGSPLAQDLIACGYSLTGDPNDPYRDVPEWLRAALDDIGNE